MIKNTSESFREVISKCKDIFEKKTRDYGTAWRILRLSSITDQIFIKARRIRSIQEKGQQKVNEDISDEFIAIINYCVMALIQIDLKDDPRMEIPADEAVEKYESKIEFTRQLLANKNHDYGEAWRDMRVSSMVDIILMKLLRVKQIEDNSGSTLVSEGVDANYQDMINYAVFCVIKLEEEYEASSK